MMYPTKTKLARLDQLPVELHGRKYSLPYFYRDGASGPAVLFVHGLGGAKENFYAAFQSPALADCTLVMFDQPGTGLAEYYSDAGLNVSGLADITNSVAERLLPQPYFLVGASMGGLITLLQVRRHGLGRIEGLISLEGNLASEDCMFSRRVVPHSLESFSAGPFEQIAQELRSSSFTGDRIISHNMLLNVDMHAYHAYSFETVAESDSGRLLDEFVELQTRRLFLYGDANRHLSYLPRLRSSDAVVVEIPSSGHFVFYDNPVATFQAIGEFVHAQATSCTQPLLNQ